ncbi:MAG: 4Fe-4S binding protein [Bacteroidales bacterium]|nr:4Fe-4S binding protein [Bacteroidales bacterium]MCF8328437.1 4Fe-4S binding protein [Bacteroidales bacterium]
MSKILIDLIKYRDCVVSGCDKKLPEGIISTFPERDGLKPIREMAVFAFSCRRCEDAPCIEVCPEEALKKDQNGMIIRSTNLCVACKSCVSICPFGTMMTDFYEYKRDESRYFDLNKSSELEQFINESPEGFVQYTEQDKDEDNNIFELMPGVLVCDHSWEELKKLK